MCEGVCVRSCLCVCARVCACYNRREAIGEAEDEHAL